jgi:hypothetical protein
VQEAKTALAQTRETWIVLELCTGGSLSSLLYGGHGGAGGPGGPQGDGVPAPLPMHLRDPTLNSMVGAASDSVGKSLGGEGETLHSWLGE